MPSPSDSPKVSPSESPSLSQTLPLFAFGTLRRGEPNHHYLSGHYDRCLPATLRDYRRTVAAHGFPALVPAPGETVSGELFFIRISEHEKTMRGCDDLEDIPPGQISGPFYRRAAVTVETPNGPFLAWAYVNP